MRKLLLLVALMVASITTSFSQERKSVEGKEIRGRELEWKDFKGKIDPASRWNAYTDWVTDYRFSAPDINNGRVRLRVDVRLFLTSNSWVRPDKQTDLLLQHERGHYNIGRICVRQIEDAINSSWFSVTNFRQEIDDIYWKVIRRCKEFERQYEVETKHYNDQEQQAIWNKKIADLLKK